MKTNRTSANHVLEYLRQRGAEMDLLPTGQRVISLETQAANEIERLTQLLSAEEYSRMAERNDRLQRDLKEYGDGITELTQERDRLRGANKRRHDALYELIGWLMAEFKDTDHQGDIQAHTQAAIISIRPDDGFADETSGPPRSKYGRGPKCPKCGSDDTSALSFDVNECAACGHEFTRPAEETSDGSPG